MPKQPNIVFFHCDSMDGRMIGALGHPALRRATPNLDALAARGAMFRNFYSNNPICCPSRASMLSGQYTHRCEAWNNYKGLPEDQRNLFTYFDEQGWRTQLGPRTDYLSGKHTIRARVTAWTRSANIERPAYIEEAPRVIEEDKERVHERDWVNVDRSIGWLRSEAQAEETPFLMYISVNAPHPAFTTSRHYLNQIDMDAIDIPQADDEEHPVVRYMRISRNWTHGFDEKTVRLTRAIYFAMIAEVDAMVGTVLRALDEEGLAENTYFVFSSDHGEEAMEHQLWYKMCMYEGAVRIPFIVAGPGVKQGVVIEQPASLIDLFPTLLDMAGLPRPEGLEGHSLLPELQGEPSDQPDWVLSEYTDTACNTNAFMLRQGDWKYVAYGGYRPQLFNLREDPGELQNLAPSQPDKVAEMDQLLRSIVDYPAVHAKIIAYDKGCFRRWRQEQRSEGTYEDSMARIYSGWDGLAEADIRPWTAEDEQKIVEWMNS